MFFKSIHSLQFPEVLFSISLSFSLCKFNHCVLCLCYSPVNVYVVYCLLLKVNEMKWSNDFCIYKCHWSCYDSRKKNEINFCTQISQIVRAILESQSFCTSSSSLQQQHKMALFTVLKHIGTTRDEEVQDISYLKYTKCSLRLGLFGTSNTIFLTVRHVSVRSYVHTTWWSLCLPLEGKTVLLLFAFVLWFLKIDYFVR